MKQLFAAITGIILSITAGIGVYNQFVSVDPEMNDGFGTQTAMALAQDREPTFPQIRMEDVPKDHENFESILYGYNLVNETHVYAEDKVGANLSCTSCHAGAGLQDAVASLVGVSIDYPKYIARAGDIVTIEKRINGCMVRSMNGETFEADSEELDAIVAYFDYISEDMEEGQTRPWVKSVDMKQVPTPNVQDGEALYNKSFISCHAAGGSGIGANTGPALWGETSFNDGAGLARMSKMAGFIQAYMPIGQEMTLSDQEASDLAAYILMQDRPEWGKHDKDWPEGGKPADIMTKDRRLEAQNGTIDWTEVLAGFQ